MFLETTFNQDAASHPVHAFGYDWRQSNLDSGNNLLSFIVKVLSRHKGATQVILVTHSMGGLVARAAIAMNPAVNQSIRGVVHGAQPSTGAVVAYRRFFTGATPSFDGGDPASRVIEQIMGTTPTDYATILCNMPGPMQLMPSHLYPSPPDRPWLKTSPQADLSTVFAIYAQPFAPGILLNPLSSPDPFGVMFTNTALLAQVAQAAAFHQLLGDLGHPKTHVLSSTGLNTDVGVDFTGSSMRVIKRPLGDGTVPSVSGACPGIRDSFVKSREKVQGLEHAGVYKDDGFNNKVARLVRLILS
jgi:pimeloyl-ACP methyl ester carboxylesterase